MINNDDLFHVGFISKTHGYSGYFYLNFVNPYFPSDNFEEYIFLLLNGKAVPFFIEHCAEVNEKFALIKIEDIDTKEQISKYSGFKVFINKKKHFSTIPEDNFNPDSIVGFTLLNEKNEALGIVKNILQSPAHYLLELYNDSLVPLHSDLIIDIDEKCKTIRMNLPEGLI